MTGNILALISACHHDVTGLAAVHSKMWSTAKCEFDFLMHRQWSCNIHDQSMWGTTKGDVHVWTVGFLTEMEMVVRIPMSPCSATGRKTFHTYITWLVSVIRCKKKKEYLNLPWHAP